MLVSDLLQGMPNKDNQIGAVFTPLSTAVGIIEKYELFDKWLEGASFLDPTAGEGNFLEAFISIALSRGLSTDNLPLDRLYGIEMQTFFVLKFFHKMRNVYGIQFPEENFICADFILFNQELKVDYLIGNPPWLNFTDLPELYKPLMKPFFYRYSLVASGQDLWLGGSRTDFSALIVNKSIYENLKPGGQAFFFLPMSLFLNEGANRGFRAYKVNEVHFATKEIYDYKNQKIFGNIGTRFCFARFERNAIQQFPVPYYQMNEEEKWISLSASPVFAVDNPLSITQNDEEYVALSLFEKICVPKSSKPRQGVNTCGANEVFVFDRCKNISDTLAVVSNKYRADVVLPQKYLFPLIATRNFSEKNPKPHKWILLPYNPKTGRSLEWKQIEKEEYLVEHLQHYEVRLKRRKGAFLQSYMDKGHWWSLLGVGPYCFENHKIVWEAYGKKHFRAIVLSGNWQGNQAMHAFMPMDTLELAMETLETMKPNKMESYLSSMQMEGTCNWAQPGKMKNLMNWT